MIVQFVVLELMVILSRIDMKKGQTFNHTEEAKRKIKINNAKFWLGRPRSKETRKKISEKLKGIKSNDALERYRANGGNNKGKHWKVKDTSKMHHSAWNKGRIGFPRAGNPEKWKHTKETILKISGQNNHSWINGLSRNGYPNEFNHSLKLKIRTRDNFICCLCGRTEREELEELNRALCVNHIDFNKNNCKESNLNTLCLRCNVKINREREYWVNFFLNV